MEKINLTANNGIDDSQWAIMELTLPDRTWKYEEPAAIITPIEDGGVEIKVDRFTLEGLPGINSTDTGKHFYMSKRAFDLKGVTKAKLSVEMAAQAIHADGQNYQYGFVNTILQDADNSLIFDSCTTGKRIFTIYEKLFIPGVVKAEDAFTYSTEAPFVIATHDLDWHTHTIEFDFEKKSVLWMIDEKKINSLNAIEEMPTSFRIGIGLFTIKPYENGKSVSIQGQGMLGRWKNLTLSILK